MEARADKRKKRNIKKEEGTAYTMLRNMAKFASMRGGPRKMKIGRKAGRSRSAVRNKTKPPVRSTISIRNNRKRSRS